MKCKYCGTELPKETNFCPNCGKDLSKLNKCVKCGEIIDDDATFCPYCGTEQPHYDEPSANNGLKWLWGILAVLVLAIAGGSYFYYTQKNGGETTVDSAKVDTLAKAEPELKTPSFNQLIQFYEKGINDPYYSTPENILERLSGMGLDQIYLKEYMMLNWTGDTMLNSYDIVYGKNVSFKVLSTHDCGMVESSRLTPKMKNYFAVELFGIQDLLGLVLDEMVVFVGNEKLWNQLKKDGVEYGIIEETTSGTGKDGNTYYFDGPSLVFIKFDIKDGEYVITFNQEH